MPQQMDVVVCTADDGILNSQLFRDASKIRMQPRDVLFTQRDTINMKD